MPQGRAEPRARAVPRNRRREMVLGCFTDTRARGRCTCPQEWHRVLRGHPVSGRVNHSRLPTLVRLADRRLRGASIGAAPRSGGFSPPRTRTVGRAQPECPAGLHPHPQGWSACVGPGRARLWDTAVSKLETSAFIATPTDILSKSTVVGDMGTRPGERVVHAAPLGMQNLSRDLKEANELAMEPPGEEHTK